MLVHVLFQTTRETFAVPFDDKFTVGDVKMIIAEKTNRKLNNSIRITFSGDFIDEELFVPLHLSNNDIVPPYSKFLLSVDGVLTSMLRVYRNTSTLCSHNINDNSVIFALVQQTTCNIPIQLPNGSVQYFHVNPNDTLGMLKTMLHDYLIHQQRVIEYAVTLTAHYDKPSVLGKRKNEIDEQPKKRVKNTY
jgi:hypothetical protein